MSTGEGRSVCSSPAPCPDCDTSASVTSDLHKYHVACTCKPGSVQYACAEDPGPPPPPKGDTPPALPPRPPVATLARRNASLPPPSTNEAARCSRRKYAWWCVGCGALAAALGGLLAAAHILLRAYTASPHHLETVPAAVPAAMLVLTGVCIMSLARRRNRYSYMIKVVGACCLVCALTCVLVTITTTVIHMNKLQTLKFCEYTRLTRTCTCFSLPPDLQHAATDDDGVRCVFEGVSDCGVVHGVLYWCLRGVFALSVTAVLVCIFSSMLAYQLLSHERKKMYWEQLELRCRSLYRPPTSQAGAHSSRPAQGSCPCCQCHRGWDVNIQQRVWAGRAGNLYSPNPGSSRKTSAWSWFPWPRASTQRCRMGTVPQSGDSAYGFVDTDNPQPNPANQYEDRQYHTAYSQNLPRSQSQNPAIPGFNQTPAQNLVIQNSQGFVQSQQFPQGQGFQGQALSGGFQEGFGESSGTFDVQNGVWGPPPPYSPQGRGASRHHLHQETTTLLHHHHIELLRNSIHDHAMGSNLALHAMPCQNRNSSYIGHVPHSAHLPADLSHEISQLNPDMSHLSPEISHLTSEIAHLAPEIQRLSEMPHLQGDLQRIGPRDLKCYYPDVRMTRLESEVTRLGPIARLDPEVSRVGTEARFATLRGHLVPFGHCQRSMGLSMGSLHGDCRSHDDVVECVHQKNRPDQVESVKKHGKENLGFQNDKNSPLRASMQLHCAQTRPAHNAESEVYFADVSSCCNISLKTDCCNHNVSALVGTIENHPESTSESETNSLTLTRQQKPQPQTGSKRRLKPQDKSRASDRHDLRNACLNHAPCHSRDKQTKHNVCHDPQCHMEQSYDGSSGSNNRSICQSDRSTDSKNSDRSMESLRQDRSFDCSRSHERFDPLRQNDDSNGSMRLKERFNSSMHERSLNSMPPIDSMREHSHNGSLMNESFASVRTDSNTVRRTESPKLRRVSGSPNRSMLLNESLNRSVIMSDSPKHSMRNDSPKHSMRNNSPKLNSPKHSMRHDSPKHARRHDSPKSSMSPKSLAKFAESSKHAMKLDLKERRMSEQMNNSLSEQRYLMNEQRRLSEQYNNLVDRSPKLRMKNMMKNIKNRDSPSHPRQSSSDSNNSHQNNPEFFVPPPPAQSPLSPGTEESLLSDEDVGKPNEKLVKKQNGAHDNQPCLGPDSRYEGPRDGKGEEGLKLNHNHCYSDTNTMDSGWQSGSEKQMNE